MMLKADKLLEAVAQTLKDRDRIYGQNDEITGQILTLLFPRGITLNTPEDHRMFHFLGHIVGKLTRFTNSGMKHEDSLHDLIGYAALAAGLVKEHDIEVNNGGWTPVSSSLYKPGAEEPGDRPRNAEGHWTDRLVR